MPSKTFAVLCFTICGALVCAAQVEQGAISGAVADQTRAAIGAAKVTATNEGTNTMVLFGTDVVDSSTLQGKVLLGYQGWFNCPGDGAPGNSWRTWARGVPAANTLTVDLYPDLSELDSDEACPVPGMSIGTKPAYLYSAWNQKTVMRHFLWMKQYGLDGVLVQRFVTSMAGKRSSGDVVLKNVMAGAEKYGRVFAIEYDITGADPVKVGELLIEDWKYLVDELKVTSHPNYLHDRESRCYLSGAWGFTRIGMCRTTLTMRNASLRGFAVDLTRNTESCIWVEHPRTGAR